MLNIMWALLSSTISSFGMVLQKKGIKWISWKKNKQQDFRKPFITWLIGILLAYIISAIPMGIASKTLPPHIITAMSGWGIVVIVILSFFLLKEHIFLSDVFYSLIIVGCTIMIGLFSEPMAIVEENFFLMLLLFIAPSLFILPIFFKSLSRKVKATLLSIFSGSMGGVAIVYFNMLVRQYFTHGILGIPMNILTLYILAAISGAIAEQASYKIGEMTVVASIRLSLFIVYPVLCSIVLYKAQFNILQFISIALIIISCYYIFKKR